MALVVFNQKGGVGKSTIACNLAAIGAARGRRTLVIDLDAQGNASRYLLGDAVTEPGPTVADFYEQTLSYSVRSEPPQAFVRRTPFEGLDVWVASAALRELQPKLEARHKIYKLREALVMLAADYADIVIDTPPALDFYTRSALMGASGCLIPFDCDAFARHALYALLDDVAEIRADHNPGLAVRGIVVNQFQARAALPARLVQALRDEGLPVLEPFVPASVKVRESHERACPLIHLDVRHPVTQAYVALYERLMPSADGAG
jgi:chromosome partitioning protein